MKAIFFFCFLTLSSFAHAAESLDFQLYPVNSEVRFERSADQILEARKPRALAAGLRYGTFSGLFEMSNFSEESGNATLRVERSLQSYLLWGRMHFLEQEKSSFDFSLYVGLAAGTYQESITTTLLGAQTKDVGSQTMAGGTALGIDGAFRFYKNFALTSALEVRLLFGQDFDPNPQSSGVWRLGIQF